MKPELIKGHLDLLVLTLLARGPLHGYAVVTALREQSGGAFDLPEGTVYPALHRLEKAGYISSDWAEHGGRRRRTYMVTAFGRTALDAMSNEYRCFTTGIQAILGGVGG